MFLAAIPVLGSLAEDAASDGTFGPPDVDGRLLRGHVTGTERRVTAGRDWIPEDPSFRFEAEPADTLGLALYLYERDDGRLRRGLVECFGSDTWPVTVRDDPDWARVWKELVSRVAPVLEGASGVTIVLKVLAAIAGVLPAVIKELRKDDLIAAQVLTAPLDDETSFVSRELVFAGTPGRGSYVVEVTLSQVHGTRGLLL